MFKTKVCRAFYFVEFRPSSTIISYAFKTVQAKARSAGCKYLVLCMQDMDVISVDKFVKWFSHEIALSGYAYCYSIDQKIYVLNLNKVVHYGEFGLQGYFEFKQWLYQKSLSEGHKIDTFQSERFVKTIAKKDKKPTESKAKKKVFKRFGINTEESKDEPKNVSAKSELEAESPPHNQPEHRDVG